MLQINSDSSHTFISLVKLTKDLKDYNCGIK